MKVLLSALTHLTLPNNTTGHFNPHFSQGHYHPGRSVFGTLDNALWQGGVKGEQKGMQQTCFLVGQEAQGSFTKKHNHPISEQVGIQSLYCQGPLPVGPTPLQTYRKTPSLGMSWGGEASIGRLCSALWPGQYQQGGYVRKGC